MSAASGCLSALMGSAIYEVLFRGHRGAGGWSHDALAPDLMRRDPLEAAMSELEAIQNRESAYTGLATGFRDLDDLTSGLQPGNLVIIAARPGIDGIFNPGTSMQAIVEAFRKLASDYRARREARTAPALETPGGLARAITLLMQGRGAQLSTPADAPQRRVRLVVPQVPVVERCRLRPAPRAQGVSGNHARSDVTQSFVQLARRIPRRPLPCIQGRRHALRLGCN